MIHKSYLVENNIQIIKNKLVLVYGENIGLINELKIKIVEKHKTNRILRFNQDDLINNQEKIYNEINNDSLFEDKKIIFIENVNDKILDVAKIILNKTNDNFIYLFTDLLDKKSKLRNWFEKEKNVDVIPCYKDNDAALNKLIQEKLKNYSGLTKEVINFIIENCSQNRIKVTNEINKINTYFYNKPLNIDQLIKLINLKEDENFSELRDSSIAGEKKTTNNLLNSMNIENDKVFYYLSLMNLRFFKLMTVLENKQNLEKSINDLKPPIFWKDKPAFIKQANLWNLKKINLALNKNYEVEKIVKTNSSINKTIILRKFILDICNLANAA